MEEGYHENWSTRGCLKLTVYQYSNKSNELNNKMNELDTKIYRVVTVEKPPFVMYDPQNDLWTGLCIDYMRIVAEILHINYTIHKSQDGEYGYLEDDGKYSIFLSEWTYFIVFLCLNIYEVPSYTTLKFSLVNIFSFSTDLHSITSMI